MKSEKKERNLPSSRPLPLQIKIKSGLLGITNADRSSRQAAKGKSPLLKSGRQKTPDEITKKGVGDSQKRKEGPSGNSPLLVGEEGRSREKHGGLNQLSTKKKGSRPKSHFLGPALRRPVRSRGQLHRVGEKRG